MIWLGVVAVVGLVAIVCGAFGFLLWASTGAQPVPAIVIAFERQRSGAGRAAGHDRGISVLSYNIGYASGRANNVRLNTQAEIRENLASMRELLAVHHPDVAALQEVDLRASRSFDIDEARNLGEGLFESAAVSVTWDKQYVPYPYWPPSQHFGRLRSGQATLSGHPLPRVHHHVFSKPESNGWLKNLFYLERVALFTRVETPAAPVLVVNVHLEAFDAEVRARQATELRALLADPPEGYRGLPLVVTGDFNDVPGSETLRRLCAGGFLKDAAGTSALPTFPAWEPVQTLDHILVGEGIEIEGFERLQPAGMPSDHLPVFAKLALSRKPN